MDSIINNKLQYKVYQFGNYPLLKDGSPKSGVWRIKLPADADWTGKDEPKQENPEE